MRASRALHSVLAFVCTTLLPRLRESRHEIDAILRALDGRYVPAGPSGAPTRGMAHVLPTGRNFYALDPRAIPSAAAWRDGPAMTTSGTPPATAATQARSFGFMPPVTATLCSMSTAWC